MKTVSLELAKQLKEAGIEIETYYSWYVSSMAGSAIVRSNVAYENTIPAPTTDELLEWLATYCEVTLSNVPYETEEGTQLAWVATAVLNSMDDTKDSHSSADTPADALAKLALWVKEQEKSENE